MKILSIETSCDDTAITIMECKGGVKNPSFKILADTSNSQIKIHAKYGGVYPMLAKRAHIKNLPILLGKALKGAKLEKSERPVDAIAVTYGPGLEPALWAGIVFAKELAKKWTVPLIPVNHMEGHILSVFAKAKGKFTIPKVNMPVLSLLVSGGHTELVISKDFSRHKIIGETLDDAAGEAYDKVARMLGLLYPGGPKISKLAEEARILREGSIAQRDGASIAIRQQANMRAESAQDSGFFKIKENQILRGHNFSAKKFTQSSGRRPVESPQGLFSFIFPRPMLHSKNFDFSFSGLKTSVLYLIKKIGKLDKKMKSEIALEFENAVVETLVRKTTQAKEKYKANTIIVAGGVAANKFLKLQMKKAFSGKNLFFPDKKLTGDNAIMIGIAGYLNYVKNKRAYKKIKNIKAKGDLKL